MMQLKPTHQDCEHRFEDAGCPDYLEDRTKDQTYLFEKSNLSITKKKGKYDKLTRTLKSNNTYNKYQIRYLFALVVLIFILSLVAIVVLTTQLRKTQLEQEVVRKERNLQSNPTGSSICQANELLCDNGKDCYYSDYKCDGIPDCPDNSDEDEANCHLPPTCPEQTTRCEDGTCVNYHEQCPTQIDPLSIKTSLLQTVDTTSSTRQTLAVSDSFMSDSLQVSSKSSKYTSSDIISEKTITSAHGILMTSSVMANLTSSIDTLASTQIPVDTLPMVLNTDVTPTAVIRTSSSDSCTTSSTTELVLSSMSTVASNSDFTSSTVTKTTTLHHSTISTSFSDSRTQTPLATDAAFSLSTRFIMQATPFNDSKQLSSSTESVVTQSVRLTKSSSSLETSHVSSLPFDWIATTITGSEMSTPRSIELPSFAIPSDVKSFTPDSSTIIIKSVDTSILSEKSSGFSDAPVFPTGSDWLLSPSLSIRSTPVTETLDSIPSSATSSASQISDKIHMLSSFDETFSSSVPESKKLTIQTYTLSDQTSASTLTLTSFPEALLPLNSFTNTTTGKEMLSSRSISSSSRVISSDEKYSPSHSSILMKSIDTAILSDKSSTFSDTSVFPTVSDLDISPTSSIRCVSVTETSDDKSSSVTSTFSHISEKIQILSSSFDETLSSLSENTELTIQTQSLSDRMSASTLTMAFPESSLSFDSFTDTTTGIEMSASLSISSSPLVISSDGKSSPPHFSTPMQSVNSAHISDKLSTFSNTVHLFAASSDVVISPTSSKPCASVIETLDYKSSSKASTVNHISDEIQILSSSFDETFSSLMERTEFLVQTQSLSDRKSASTLVMTTFPKSSLSFDLLTDTTTSTGIILSSPGYISSSSLLISSDVESFLSHSLIAIKSVENSILSETSSTFSDPPVFPTSSDVLISPTSSIRSAPVTETMDSKSSVTTSTVISNETQILLSSFDETFSGPELVSTNQTQSLDDQTSSSKLITTTFPESSLVFDSLTDTATSNGIILSSSGYISSSLLLISSGVESPSYSSTAMQYNTIDDSILSEKSPTFSDPHVVPTGSDVLISPTSSIRSAPVTVTLDSKSSATTINHLSNEIQILSSSLDEIFSSLIESTASSIQTQSLSDRKCVSTLIMTTFSESSLVFDSLTDTTINTGIILSSSGNISSSSLLISSGVEYSSSYSSIAIQYNTIYNAIASEKSSTFSDTPVMPMGSDVLLSPTSSILSVPVTETLDSKSSATTSTVSHISYETQILFSSFDETFSDSEIGSKESTIQMQSLPEQTSSSTLIFTSISESSKIETSSSTLLYSSSVFIMYPSRTYKSLESQSTVMPISTATSLPTTNVTSIITTIVTPLATVSVSSTSLGNQTTTHAPGTDEPFPGWIIAVIVCGSVIFLYFCVLIFVMPFETRPRS